MIELNSTTQQVQFLVWATDDFILEDKQESFTIAISLLYSSVPAAIQSGISPIDIAIMDNEGLFHLACRVET